MNWEWLIAVLRSPTAIELFGLAAIVVGVAMVFLPAGFVVGGVGAVLWAQGARAKPKEPER